MIRGFHSVIEPRSLSEIHPRAALKNVFQIAFIVACGADFFFFVTLINNSLIGRLLFLSPFTSLPEDNALLSRLYHGRRYRLNSYVRCLVLPNYVCGIRLFAKKEDDWDVTPNTLRRRGSFPYTLVVIISKNRKDTVLTHCSTFDITNRLEICPLNENPLPCGGFSRIFNLKIEYRRFSADPLDFQSTPYDVEQPSDGMLTTCCLDSATADPIHVGDVERNCVRTS